MNKLTKGTLAAAAAVALLLGAGGTLAYWNDSENVGASGGTTITAGDLQITQDDAPTWSIKHGDADPVAVDDIANLRIVPGDQLVYSGSYLIAAQGQNLSFTASIGQAAIAAASNSQADLALRAALVEGAKFTIDGDEGNQATIVHTSNSAAEYPVTISVTLTWPFDGATTADNNAKLGKVNLSNFAITVTQIETGA